VRGAKRLPGSNNGGTKTRPPIHKEAEAVVRLPVDELPRSRFCTDGRRAASTTAGVDAPVDGPGAALTLLWRVRRRDGREGLGP